MSDPIRIVPYHRVEWENYPHLLYSRWGVIRMVGAAALLLLLGAAYPVMAVTGAKPVNPEVMLCSVFLLLLGLLMLASLIYKLLTTGTMGLPVAAAGASGILRPSWFYYLHIPWTTICTVNPQDIAIPRSGFLKPRYESAIRIISKDRRWNGFWHTHVTGWSNITFPDRTSRDSFLKICDDYLDAAS